MPDPAQPLAPGLGQPTASCHTNHLSTTGCFMNICKRAPLPFKGRRWVSQAALDRLAEPVQSYISTSCDPYVNLSIEHYLLQKSAPESAVLFLYVNRPSIIIGRNQNPWLEVNLALLNPASPKEGQNGLPVLGTVDLVRRRSGGGTVFHDEGNVNWTVICPSKHFTRDKHAEMIVRGLRSCGIARSRVNERHDIVLDQGLKSADTDPNDMHVTPYTTSITDGEKALKVSGSAYKLTRLRALHHGTCLLSSPNLTIIPSYLHSPAKSYITARGVESVSSPVGNILLSNDVFIRTVQREFMEMYGIREDAKEVGEDWLGHDPVRKGYEELKSPEWTYLQTPQFTISNESDPHRKVDVSFTVRHGALSAGYIRDRGIQDRKELPPRLVGYRIDEIGSWQAIVEATLKPYREPVANQVSEWLQTMLPIGSGRK